MLIYLNLLQANDTCTYISQAYFILSSACNTKLLIAFQLLTAAIIPSMYTNKCVISFPTLKKMLDDVFLDIFKLEENE